MKNTVIVASLFFTITIGNTFNATAQTLSQIEGTVWEYLWDDNMHRDFIAFVSNDRAVSYSFELDEFEISNYCIHEDTIITTTSNMADESYRERPIGSMSYFYKNEGVCLVLLFTTIKYVDGQLQKTYPDEPYKLCLK
jgi:hypothetical protein